jgi:hypothetical protein
MQGLPYLLLTMPYAGDPLSAIAAEGNSSRRVQVVSELLHLSLAYSESLRPGES